jgi:hypothetical protein
MANSIIVSLHPMMHVVEVTVWMMHCMIGADWVMIVVPMATIPIQVWIDVVIWSPPCWPIVPIVWRMPAYPCSGPEPIVDKWSVDIDRLDDIVGSVDVLITNHLNRNRLCGFVFLDEDGSYILINILRKYGLDHNKMFVIVSSLNHS